MAAELMHSCNDLIHYIETARCIGSGAVAGPLGNVGRPWSASIAADDACMAASPGKRQNPRNRAAAGRPDPFGRVSRPEKSVQRLEKVQNRLGNRHARCRQSAPDAASAQPFLQAAEGTLAMTDRWAAVLASGKIRITVPPPAGRTPSAESRARKSPRNALKRFKTGSEIGDARASARLSVPMH